MDRIALVVFDMAGTTIEDAGQVPEAFEAVLAARGLSVTADELRAVRGASKREAIRLLVERQRPVLLPHCDAIFDAFRDHLARLYREGGIATLDGAADTFAWLRARGVRVALTTGFDRSITDLIVQTVGWDRDAADAIVCGDDVPEGRPAPYLIFRAMELNGTHRVRNVATVGDTALDLQAGDNAGVGLNIGVLSGAHRREQLERAPHTHLLPGVGALPGLLQSLGVVAQPEEAIR
jgi:phosphonatase-like hydrolase